MSAAGLVVLACVVTWPQQPTSGAAASAEHRERAFGMARRSNRSPWAGATVRLLAVPFEGCTERDVVEVTSDERGEFRAQILVGLGYTAWACSADGTDWIVSQRLDDVVPRLPIVLDEARREGRVTVRLSGLEPWRVVSPIKLWCSGAKNGEQALPLVVRGDAEVLLPPMGTGERWLFLGAGNGLDLVRREVPSAARGVMDLALPPPHEVVVTVRTPDGAPVAGAQIEIHGPSTTVLPPRTDAEGHATVVVPEPDSRAPRHPPLWAWAPGHLTARLWREGADPAGPWPLFVMPTAVPEVMIEWRAGEPIADAPVFVCGVEQSLEPTPDRQRARPNGQFASDGHRRTAADGKVLVPYDPTYPLLVGVLLPPSGMHDLQQRFGAGLSPLALLHAAVPRAPAMVARVDALRPVRFVFRHHDRSPAPRAHVRLGGGASPGVGLGYVADQASSITVLLPPQDDIMLAAWHATAGDIVKVVVPAVHGAREVAEVIVELPEPIRVTGTVADATGAPLPGATVSLGATLGGRQSEWQPLDAVADAVQPRVVARGYYYQPMAQPMFTRSVVTDAAGRFVLDLPSRGYPLEFLAEHAGRRSGTEWRRAEHAGTGEGDVLLVVQ